MRTSHSFALVCVFGAAFAALLPACGSSDEPAPSGGAGATAQGGSSSAAGGSTAAGGSAAIVGDPAKGAAIWTNSQIGCPACHADSAAGLLGPNITFSKTAGIGNWTLAQFSAAVRDGKDIDGSSLCASMTKFPSSQINDQGMADLFAYLGTKPISDTPEKGSACP